MQIRKKPVTRSYWLICTIIALIFILPLFIIQRSYAVSPIVQSCSNGVTSPTTAAKLNCTFTNPVVSGNLIIALITCYGCSIIANPINNDSLNLVYHTIVENCCSATGAAQISTIFAANITTSASDTVSAQIQDSVNRTTWLMSAFEIDGTQVSHKIIDWITVAGFSGVASTVQISPAVSWSFTNSLIFEAAESDNGLQPVCTATFTSGPTNPANQHCYSFSYAQSNSPSSFTMGSFGGSTSMSEVVLIMNLSPSIPTTTASVDTGLISGSINEAVAFVAWLIPSLVILFLFTWLGLKAGAGTEVVLMLEIFAFAIIGVMGFLFSTFLQSSIWPPFWIALLGIVFCIVGLAYSQGRKT